MGRNQPVVLAVIGSTFAGCCVVVECAGAVSVLSQPILRDLGGIQQATKRFRLGCAALGVCCVSDCLNADLERGWIVLMVARSNRQRSDRQRKRLSVFILASLPRDFPTGVDVAFYLLPTSRVCHNRILELVTAFASTLQLQ